MKLESRPTRFRATALALACLLGAIVAIAQAPPTSQSPEPKPQMAKDVFKNVQVLRGIPLDQFMGTMGFISAALSMNCSECHIGIQAKDVWDALCGRHPDETDSAPNDRDDEHPQPKNFGGKSAW